MRALIYERDRKALAFLKDFFSRCDRCSTTFAPDLTALRKSLKEKTPDVLIVSSSSLGGVGLSAVPCPVIATVASEADLQDVVRHGVDSYLLFPLRKDDLSYKLELAFKKKSNFDAVLQEKKHLAAMQELTHMAASSLDPEEILYLVVRKLSEVIPVTRCSMLSTGLGEGRHVTVVSSFEDPSIKDLRLDLRKYPEIDKALKTKEPVVVRDAMKDPLMKAVKPLIKPIGIRSIIVLPIVFRSEVIGTLFLRTNRTGRAFSDREIKLCQSIANVSASALNNAFLFEKLKAERARLEKLSITDFLTGIYNTRYLYHRLEDEFNRSDRYNCPLGCVMLDIDYFKRINDTYGHRAGDMVLREFASLIKKHIRKSDVFARYGGEEFILLLPMTNRKGAAAEAGRLGEVVRQHRFRGLKAKQRITISLGVATVPNKKIKTHDDLIRAADDALMKAKEEGRDRLVSFD